MADPDTGAVLRRILHVSDIHCGFPFVAEHVAAALQVAATSRIDAIVISGDFSQRARVKEFERARAILEQFRAVAPTIEVPGNHDTAWWHAPFGWGDASRLHDGYRQYINPVLEPVVRVPGVTMVGLNSAAGMLPQAVTWYPRDWRVKGGLTASQFDWAQRELAASPAGDLRLLVVHHNVVRGRLSHRWGLKQPETALDRLAALPVDVVCTGHDHEARADVVPRRTGRFLVSGANTLSSRSRKHRPSALNVIEATASQITVRAWGYHEGVFVPGPMSATLDRR
ncbi:metallophosphoesterase [Gemmatimonas sp.]|uniref:metallophosphoesterase family protein n=1 Tax=Gemmatimonas sp. TaxID=1962908 RepID=UPI00286E920C|nr:metallophosphoesterase [Gemmatimonas sp.]